MKEPTFAAKYSDLTALILLFRNSLRLIHPAQVLNLHFYRWQSTYSAVDNVWNSYPTSISENYATMSNIQQRALLRHV